MLLKDLIVHLDQGERTQQRLDLAVTLARAHNAQLLGIFAQRGEAYRIGVVASWPNEAYARAAEASKKQFLAATKGLAQAEWRDLNRGSDAEIRRHFTAAAHRVDMVLLGQYDEEAPHYTSAEFAEDLVESAGRPILFLPYAGHFPTLGKRPLIAWSDSREAARAVNDALPLMANCEEAFILSFATQREEAELSCADVARHLAAYGIKAKTEVLPAEGLGIMDMLLNRVADKEADLLIMGGHGHPSLAHLGRGAGTRHIFRHMTVPVLMSA